MSAKWETSYIICLKPVAETRAEHRYKLNQFSCVYTVIEIEQLNSELFNLALLCRPSSVLSGEDVKSFLAGSSLQWDTCSLETKVQMESQPALVFIIWTDIRFFTPTSLHLPHLIKTGTDPCPTHTFPSTPPLIQTGRNILTDFSLPSYPISRIGYSNLVCQSNQILDYCSPFISHLQTEWGCFHNTGWVTGRGVRWKQACDVDRHFVLFKYTNGG